MKRRSHAVGVSGGKESLVLLPRCGICKTLSKTFPVEWITLSLVCGEDFAPVVHCAQTMTFPYTLSRQISKKVSWRYERKNPCSHCAKMRRCALNDAIRALGIKKHPWSSLRRRSETFLMSLYLWGRMSCLNLWPDEPAGVCRSDRCVCAGGA
jgi:hypothetical protein